MVCLRDKVKNGPAAYNECLRRQLALLDEPIRESTPRKRYKTAPPSSDYSYQTPTLQLEPRFEASPVFHWPEWRSGVPGKKPSTLNEKLELTHLFQKVSPSIFVVLAAPTKSKLLREESVSQGSAVAISESHLITNCHVLDGRPFIVIIQKNTSALAEVIRADPATDRCILKASEINLIAISGVRSRGSLKVGESVYSIGTPSGLEQTLGEGIISGLREYKGVHSIQTTAPISPGSSGGGLFDNRGNLIGITTFLLKESQALNFALLAEAYWN